MVTSRIAVWVFGERFEPPPEIPPKMIPEGVVLRRGGLIPRLGGIFSRMRRPAAAVTLGDTIVFNPGVRVTVDLLAHELVHVRQWREDRLFPLHYVLSTMKHGYEENPYEVEARAHAHAPHVHDSGETS